jgi:hypothetical protein
MERAAGFAHDDQPQAKLDKLDALLAQSCTPRQDAALLAEMLSLPNDGRHPTPWCRWQSLLLDDPVQHVDDCRALNLVEVLAAIRRSGRQVVIAVGDAALADVLCRRLRSSQTEPGRRCDLSHSADGSAKVERELDIMPLPLEAMPLAIAS